MSKSNVLAWVVLCLALVAFLLRLRPSYLWRTALDQSLVFTGFHAPHGRVLPASSNPGRAGTRIKAPSSLNGDLPSLRAAHRFEVRTLQNGVHVLRGPLFVAVLSIVGLGVAILWSGFFGSPNDQSTFSLRFLALLLGPIHPDGGTTIIEADRFLHWILIFELTMWGAFWAASCGQPLGRCYAIPYSRQGRLRLAFSLAVKCGLSFYFVSACVGICLAWILTLVSGAAWPDGIPHMFIYCAIALLCFPLSVLLCLHVLRARWAQIPGLDPMAIAVPVGLVNHLLFNVVVETLHAPSKDSAIAWVSLAALTLACFGLLRWALGRHFLRADLG